MSVSIMRAEGVTVLTVTSDGDPVNCPLMCQLLCMLCYCPGVNVFRRPPSSQSRSQSKLGALHIMVGVLILGLGLNSPGYYDDYYGYMYMPSDTAWFGIVFIILGITSILSERFYYRCMVVLSVILNLCGVGFALTTLIRYSIQTFYVYDRSFTCKSSEDSRGWYESQTSTPSPTLDALRERCLEFQALMFIMKICFSALLSTLSFLEMCVALSSAIHSIKALRKRKSEPNDGQDPVLEKTTADHTP